MITRKNFIVIHCMLSLGWKSDRQKCLFNLGNYINLNIYSIAEDTEIALI